MWFISARLSINTITLLMFIIVSLLIRSKGTLIYLTSLKYENIVDLHSQSTYSTLGKRVYHIG